MLLSCSFFIIIQQIWVVLQQVIEHGIIIMHFVKNISDLVKGRGTACGGGIQIEVIGNSEEVNYRFYPPINYSL